MNKISKILLLLFATVMLAITGCNDSNSQPEFEPDGENNGIVNEKSEKLESEFDLNGCKHFSFKAIFKDSKTNAVIRPQEESGLANKIRVNVVCEDKTYSLPFPESHNLIATSCNDTKVFFYFNNYDDYFFIDRNNPVSVGVTVAGDVPEDFNFKLDVSIEGVMKKQVYDVRYVYDSDVSRWEVNGDKTEYNKEYDYNYIIFY